MGQIIVNIAGGTPDYQVDLIIGIVTMYTFTFPTAGQKILTGISAGEYKVVVTDSNGCTVHDDSSIVCADECGSDEVYVDDVISVDDQQFPISYLSYDKGGANFPITEVPKADGLFDGGKVSWVSGFTFDVAALAAYFDGILYTSESGSITLDPAEAPGGDDRIDLIIYDTSLGITKITGVPSANPQKPSIDPVTQVELTWISVPAGATSPVGITDELIYDENVEWTGSNTGSATVVFNDATTPYHDTIDTKVTNIQNNDTIVYTAGLAVDRTDYDDIIFNIRLQAVMHSKHKLFVSFMESGASITNELEVSLDKSNTTGYQNINIALSTFVFSQASIDALKFRWSRINPAPAIYTGFYLDYIKLQKGIVFVPISSSVQLIGDVTGVGVTGSPIPTIITITSDATPVDTDEVVSKRGATWLKTTWTVLKAFLKTYFDGVYAALVHTHTFVGGLTDVPAAYTGQAGKYAKVKAGEDGLEFDIPGAGDFATKALDNLASVAINTSLISDTDSTDDLGSSSKYWANLYVDKIILPDEVANSKIQLYTGFGFGIQANQFRLYLNGSSSSFSFFDSEAGNEIVTISHLGKISINDGLLLFKGVEAKQFLISNLSNLPGFWIGANATSPSVSNYSMLGDGTGGFLFNAPTGQTVKFRINNVTKLTVAGTGIKIGDGASTNPFDVTKDGSTIVFSVLSSGIVGLGSGVANTKLAIFNDGTNFYGFGIQAAQFRFHVAISTNYFSFLDAPAGNEIVRIKGSGHLGIGVFPPTAWLHIKAGTATAGTPPIKFTSGTLLATPEACALECLTDNLHFTITTGTARKGIMLDDGTRLTSGKIPIATTNGRLIDGQTPLAGTKVYYVADSSEGAATRKLTFIDGILTAET